MQRLCLLHCSLRRGEGLVNVCDTLKLLNPRVRDAQKQISFPWYKLLERLYQLCTL